MMSVISSPLSPKTVMVSSLLESYPSFLSLVALKEMAYGSGLMFP
jgi:hypothetical protein